MPRNDAGTFAVLNPILVGSQRASAVNNANHVDIGDEITNTLALDGQGGMDSGAQFKMAKGTLAAPAMSWGVDRNLGFRRVGPNTMAWVAGSQDRMQIDGDLLAKLFFGGDVAGAMAFGGALTGTVDLPAIEALGSAAPFTGLAWRTADNTWALDDGTQNFRIERQGNGTVLTTGSFADIRIPFDATLTSVSLLADAAGSAVVDIWKVAYTSYPPLNANSITGATTPTLANARAYDDTALTGWTTSITAGDCLRFNLDSVSAITWLQVYLRMKRFT